MKNKVRRKKCFTLLKCSNEGKILNLCPIILMGFTNVGNAYNTNNQVISFLSCMLLKHAERYTWHNIRY